MIEHHEKPGENWRRAFAEHLEHAIGDLKRERERGSKREVWLDDRCLRIATISDAKLEAYARREAERVVNRAIIEHNEAKARQRARAGEAL